MIERPYHRAIVLIDGMFLQNIMNEFDLFGKVDFRKLSDKLTGPPGPLRLPNNRMQAIGAGARLGLNRDVGAEEAIELSSFP